MSGENWKADITQTDKLNKSLLSSFLDRLNSEPTSLHSNFELSAEEQKDSAQEDEWMQETISTPNMPVSEMQLLKLKCDSPTASSNKLMMPSADCSDDMKIDNNRQRIVGIGGATCGGKTTLAKRIGNDYPDAKIILGDEYYHSDDYARQHCPMDTEYDYPNYDVIEAMDMKRITQAVEEAAKTHRLVVVESMFITLHQPLMDLLTDVYFMTIDRKTCEARRKLRTDYDPPPYALYFERFAWPAYTEHYEQAQQLDNIQFLDSRLPVEVLYRRITRDLSAGSEGRDLSAGSERV